MHSTYAPVETSLPPAATVPGARPEMPMRPIHAENSAGLAINILPGTRLHVGERIAIRVSTRKSGYLMLVDVDANGKVTQIYPNVRSLMTRPAKHENANRIEPGRAATSRIRAIPIPDFSWSPRRRPAWR